MRVLFFLQQYYATIISQYFYLFIVPSGPPEEVKVHVINSTLVQAFWHPPVEDQQNGEILYYTVTIYINTGQGSHQTHTITTNSSRIQLPLLRPFSDYSITVAASTSVGRGPFIEPVFFNTPEAGKKNTIILISKRLPLIKILLLLFIFYMFVPFGTYIISMYNFFHDKH